MWDVSRYCRPYVESYMPALTSTDRPPLLRRPQTIGLLAQLLCFIPMELEVGRIDAAGLLA